MRPYTTVALGVASLLAGASAQGAIKCSQDSKCPSSAPCCSSYGQCGVGAYCLGGCDPKSSFDLLSCTAAPTCRGGKLGLKVGTDVIPNTQFLGDASTASWVSSGTPANYGDGSILLTMPASSVGTLLSSTHYVWYGKITAQLATSQGAGVVTAFILMSDMKDEIDFEFIGVDLNNAQSNYYYQGITNYDKMKNLTVSDTRGTIHTYEIDWQPDSLTWSIDGQVMRTVYKKDTYNTTDNSYHYPQSPSRVQLSLWPAGLPTNGKGTVDWSGGLVNWDSQYMQNGYYYAQIKNVNVQCYNPPKGDNNNGNSAYYYTSIAGTQNDVAIGNNDTTLASFYATGDDPKKNPNASGTKSSSSSASPSSEVQTVPGISGGGVRSDGSPSTGSDSEALSGSSGSSDGQTNVIGSTSFSQGLPGSNSAGKVQAGSAIALLGFFIAALML